MGEIGIRQASHHFRSQRMRARARAGAGAGSGAICAGLYAEALHCTRGEGRGDSLFPRISFTCAHDQSEECTATWNANPFTEQAIFKSVSKRRIRGVPHLEGYLTICLRTGLFYQDYSRNWGQMKALNILIKMWYGSPICYKKWLSDSQRCGAHLHEAGTLIKYA